MITPGWWAAVTRTERERLRDFIAVARVGATANDAERDMFDRVLDFGRERGRSGVEKWRVRAWWLEQTLCPGLTRQTQTSM